MFKSLSAAVKFSFAFMMACGGGGVCVCPLISRVSLIPFIMCWSACSMSVA